jgi:hypothetical protein
MRRVLNKKHSPTQCRAECLCSDASLFRSRQHRWRDQENEQGVAYVLGIAAATSAKRTWRSSDLPLAGLQEVVPIIASVPLGTRGRRGDRVDAGWSFGEADPAHLDKMRYSKKRADAGKRKRLRMATIHCER